MPSKILLRRNRMSRATPFTFTWSKRVYSERNVNSYNHELSKESKPQEPTSGPQMHDAVAPRSSTDVLLAVVSVRLCAEGSTLDTCALFDTGSQATILCEDVVRLLGLTRTATFNPIRYLSRKRSRLRSPIRKSWTLNSPLFEAKMNLKLPKPLLFHIFTLVVVVQSKSTQGTTPCGDLARGRSLVHAFRLNAIYY